VLLQQLIACRSLAIKSAQRAERRDVELSETPSRTPAAECRTDAGAGAGAGAGAEGRVDPAGDGPATS